MVTDTPSAPARAETAIPYGVRLLLTLFLLALYLFAQGMPLPMIDKVAIYEFLRYAQSSLGFRNFSILALGIRPLVIGFFLVELFSLVTSLGRRLRKGGAAGRAKLNRAALITSLLVSAVQAMGISMFLGSAVAPSGAPLVTSDGWSFNLITIATLTAVTAAVFLLGNVLSGYGIGNGFALLILADVIWVFFTTGMDMGRDAFIGSVFAGAGLLLVAILTGLLIRWFWAADSAQFPAFPQGVLPLVLVGPALVVVGRFQSQSFWDPTVVQTVATLILAAPFSWLTFHLFSSRPRLEANLSEPDEILDSLAATLKRRLLPSTALLAFGAAGLLFWSYKEPDTFAASLNFLGLILIVAILFDVRDQFVFLRESQKTARLAQLDNVHFAYQLVADLREKEIEPLARNLNFRSLFFFFGALFKIDVLVPQEQLGKAREILAELEVAREVRVF